MMDNENNTGGERKEESTGYVNAGSSGTNSANTADDFRASGADAGNGQNTAYNGNTQGTQYSQSTQYGQGQYNQGSQYTPNARQGGAYDYSQNYAAGGQNPQPGSGYTPPRRRRGSGNGKKWVLRVVAGALCLCVCAGAGYGGALIAMNGQTKNQIVTNTVERGTATATQTDMTQVCAQVAPSVVVITTESMVTSNSWFGGQYVESGAGSGVVLTEDGYIITCNHVVSGATNIVVKLNDDTEYTATLVGGDATSDIAVLKIDATGLTPATIGDSDTLAVGETVVAVGNPLGELGGTVTGGMISALNRSVNVENTTMSLIQTDASVSPGNSGGALFNMNGELVGIVNAKSDSDSAEGLGFAIPVNTAYDVAMELIESGYVTGRPQLGISVIDASQAANYGLNGTGLYIVEVSEGSGAEKAGLQVGDRIVSIDNTAVESTSDVVNMVNEKNVGDVMSVQIVRDGQMMTVDVELGEAKPTTTAAEQDNE